MGKIIHHSKEIAAIVLYAPLISDNHPLYHLLNYVRGDCYKIPKSASDHVYPVILYSPASGPTRILIMCIPLYYIVQRGGPIEIGPNTERIVSNIKH